MFSLFFGFGWILGDFDGLLNGFLLDVDGFLGKNHPKKYKYMKKTWNSIIQ